MQERRFKASGHRLRELRARYDLKQKELAEKIGVSEVTIGRWERGETFPRDYDLTNLAQTYKMPLEELRQKLNASLDLPQVDSPQGSTNEQQLTDPSKKEGLEQALQLIPLSLVDTPVAKNNEQERETQLLAPAPQTPLQASVVEQSPLSLGPNENACSGDVPVTVPPALPPRIISRRKLIIGGIGGLGLVVLAIAGYEVVEHIIMRPQPQIPTVSANTSKNWKQLASLKVPRNAFFGIATFSLPSGEYLVLVEGGGDLDTGGFLADSETFDPKTAIWAETPSLPYGRSGHTSTFLRNAGKVLISGGYAPSPAYPGVLSSALLYNPKAKSWTEIHEMNHKRTVHAAVQLGNDRVMVVGGWDGNNGGLISAEIFDYNNGLPFWISIADMQVGRQLPGCVLLPDGSVLVMGGFNDPLHHGLRETELYDQQTKRWIPKAPMNVGRWGFGALWLPSIRKVLVAGGITVGSSPSTSAFTQSAELYDVEQDQWTKITDMMYKRGAYDGASNAIPLNDGMALVVGGDVLGTSEVFVPNMSNPFASFWKPYDYIGQSTGRSVLLEDTGQVLFVGNDVFIYSP